MPQVFWTQRKVCFSARRNVSTYPQTRNPLEQAVVWAIVWLGWSNSIRDLLYPQIWNLQPRLFSAGFCGRCNFSSTGHYNPEWLKRTNIKSECNTEYCKMCSQLTYSLCSIRIVYKNILSFSSQQWDSIICVALTSLPINLCYHVFCNNWECHKSELMERPPIKF